MRKLMMPTAAALAVIAAMGVAQAAEHATGSIRSIDATGHAIVLSDGKTYQLPANFQASTLKVGESVNVTWDMANGKPMASAVTRVQ